VLALPDAGLDTMRHIESVCKVPPGGGVLRLLVVRTGAGSNYYLSQWCRWGGSHVLNDICNERIVQ
jgi:hypothetical protein